MGISYIGMVFPSTLLRTSGLQNGSHQRPLNLSALMDKVGESRKEASAAAVRQQVKCSAPTARTAANMIADTSSFAQSNSSSCNPSFPLGQAEKDRLRPGPTAWVKVRKVED